MILNKLNHSPIHVNHTHDDSAECWYDSEKVYFLFKDKCYYLESFRPLPNVFFLNENGFYDYVNGIETGVASKPLFIKYYEDTIFGESVNLYEEI